jgi:hypothetical protein
VNFVRFLDSKIDDGLFVCIFDNHLLFLPKPTLEMAGLDNNGGDEVFTADGDEERAQMCPLSRSASAERSCVKRLGFLI